MEILTITSENFEAEVLRSSKPVLLDFWATWCGPCQMMMPVIHEIAATRDDIVVGKINVDEEQALAEKFQILSIPTFVVMKNGRITASAMGARPKAAIEAMLSGESPA